MNLEFNEQILIKSSFEDDDLMFESVDKLYNCFVKFKDIWMLLQVT